MRPSTWHARVRVWWSACRRTQREGRAEGGEAEGGAVERGEAGSIEDPTWELVGPRIEPFQWFLRGGAAAWTRKLVRLSRQMHAGGGRGWERTAKCRRAARARRSTSCPQPPATVAGVPLSARGAGRAAGGLRRAFSDLSSSSSRTKLRGTMTTSPDWPAMAIPTMATQGVGTACSWHGRGRPRGPPDSAAIHKQPGSGRESVRQNVSSQQEGGRGARWGRRGRAARYKGACPCSPSNAVGGASIARALYRQSADPQLAPAGFSCLLNR